MKIFSIILRNGTLWPKFFFLSFQIHEGALDLMLFMHYTQDNTVWTPMLKGKWLSMQGLSRKKQDAFKVKKAK